MGRKNLRLENARGEGGGSINESGWEETKRFGGGKNRENRAGGGRHVFGFLCLLGVANRLFLGGVLVSLFRRTRKPPGGANFFTGEEPRHYMDDMMNKIIYQKEYKTMGIVKADDGGFAFYLWGEGDAHQCAVPLRHLLYPGRYKDQGVGDV